MSNRILYTIISIAIFFGLVATLIGLVTTTSESEPVTQVEEVSTSTEQIFCTADAMQCPDGSYVGRTGPNCEFACPEPVPTPLEFVTHVNEKAPFIQVTRPAPFGLIQSPLTLQGQAVGPWYFEASAPVSLVNWDGLIIAEGFITAEGEWMTEDFVPFSGTLTFENPYKDGDPEFMKRGTLIFKKDNPSGLPENDDALEIPIVFAP